MSLFSPILFFLLCFVYVEVKTKALIQENTQTGYWVDYNGKIPANAFKAGINKDGNPIYIGQVLFGGSTIPGSINVAEHKIYFDSGHAEQSIAKTFKVLCVRYSNQLKWIQTNDEKFESLNKGRLVEGGSTGNYKLYVGRITSEAETSVGKITVGKNGKRELHITKYGSAMDYLTFEVLSFDPEAPEINTETYVFKANGNSTEELIVKTGNNECVVNIYIS